MLSSKYIARLNNFNYFPFLYHFFEQKPFVRDGGFSQTIIYIYIGVDIDRSL